MSPLFDLEDPLEVSTLPNGLTKTTIVLPNVDLNKMKPPATMPAMPQVFYGPIGAILVAWSAYEVKRDYLIVNLQTYEGALDQVVPRGFDYRQKALKRLATRVFARCPGITGFIRDVLRDAKGLYKTRNALAHGVIECSISVDIPAGVIATKEHCTSRLSVTSLVNDIAVVELYEVADLERVFFDIIHCTGRLNEIEQYHKIAGIDEDEVVFLKALQMSEFRRPI